MTKAEAEKEVEGRREYNGGGDGGCGSCCPQQRDTPKRSTRGGTTEETTRGFTDGTSERFTEGIAAVWVPCSHPPTSFRSSSPSWARATRLVAVGRLVVLWLPMHVTMARYDLFRGAVASRFSLWLANMACKYLCRSFPSPPSPSLSLARALSVFLSLPLSGFFGLPFFCVYWVSCHIACKSAFFKSHHQTTCMRTRQVLSAVRGGDGRDEPRVLHAPSTR